MAEQDDPRQRKPDAGKSAADSGGPNWGLVATMGFEIGAGAGLGAFLGVWIDRHWHHDPWGVVCGTLLGISAGTYLVIKEAIKANKD